MCALFFRSNYLNPSIISLDALKLPMFQQVIAIRSKQAKHAAFSSIVGCDTTVYLDHKHTCVCVEWWEKRVSYYYYRTHVNTIGFDCFVEREQVKGGHNTL